MSEQLFISRALTRPGDFTAGIEGPACDAAGNLYAVNFAREGTVGRVTVEGECEVFVDLPEGSLANGIVFDRSGAMILADHTGHNVLTVDMETRAVRVLAHEPTMNQPNDLAIRSDGTIYASDPNWGDSSGQIWRLDTDGTLTLLETGLGTTNGIEVSTDERTLYVNESVQRNVWAYDLLPGGRISNRRRLIRFSDFGMDGMRCDAGGNLYVTRHGKGTVAKLSPKGELLLEVELCGRECTNLAFGGPDGRTCYVTVADRGNVEAFRTDAPGRSWRLWRA